MASFEEQKAAILHEISTLAVQLSAEHKTKLVHLCGLFDGFVNAMTAEANRQINELGEHVTREQERYNQEHKLQTETASKLAAAREELKMRYEKPPPPVHRRNSSAGSVHYRHASDPSTLSAFTQMQGSQLKCSNQWDHNPATVFCEDCHEQYCESCFSYLHQRPGWNSHRGRVIAGDSTTVQHSHNQQLLQQQLARIPSNSSTSSLSSTGSQTLNRASSYPTVASSQPPLPRSSSFTSLATTTATAPSLNRLPSVAALLSRNRNPPSATASASPLKSNGVPRPIDESDILFNRRASVSDSDKELGHTSPELKKFSGKPPKSPSLPPVMPVERQQFASALLPTPMLQEAPLLSKKIGKLKSKTVVKTSKSPKTIPRVSPKIKPRLDPIRPSLHERKVPESIAERPKGSVAEEEEPNEEAVKPGHTGTQRDVPNVDSKDKEGTRKAERSEPKEESLQNERQETQLTSALPPVTLHPPTHLQAQTQPQAQVQTTPTQTQSTQTQPTQTQTQAQTQPTQTQPQSQSQPQSQPQSQSQEPQAPQSQAQQPQAPQPQAPQPQAPQPQAQQPQAQQPQAQPQAPQPQAQQAPQQQAPQQQAPQQQVQPQAQEPQAPQPQAPAPAQPQPEAQPEDKQPPRSKKDILCKNFTMGLGCKAGDRCMFSHSGAPTATPSGVSGSSKAADSLPPSTGTSFTTAASSSSTVAPASIFDTGAPSSRPNPPKDDIADDTRSTVANSDAAYSSDVTWESFGLPKSVMDGIYGANFTKPSDIQAKSIAPILKKRSVIAQAKAGSGKTAAFGIGMIMHALAGGRALCVAPTRELAQQCAVRIKALAKYTPLSICLVVPEARSVQEVVAGDLTTNHSDPIVVGTPGAVRNLARSGKKFSMLVVDEADKMLDDEGKRGHGHQMGTLRDQTLQIKNALGASDCQVLLFSATFSDQILDFSKQLAKNVVMINTEKRVEEYNLQGLKYLSINCESQGKFKALTECYAIMSISQSVIFVNSKQTANRLKEDMEMEGYTVSILHGDISPAQRDATMDDFRSQMTTVLIATDVFARGIDVKTINVVINYDISENAEDYYHRVGRASRFGRKGVAINLVDSQHSRRLLQEIARQHGLEFPVIEFDPKTLEREIKAFLAA